ncbi:MAG: hypothetical protein QM655_15930 [Nocardioidaceae bacterium]
MHEQADAVMAAARAAEPAATRRVSEVATSVGARVDRLDSRFKSRESVLEKLNRFREPDSPYYRLRRFNDALRYTLVADGDYWSTASQIVREFSTDGFTVLRPPQRWRSNYKGLNLTIRGPDGFEFEVQVHTSASLRAAETTHGPYERQRRLPRGSREYRDLERRQMEIWSAVPVPPVRLRVD